MNVNMANSISKHIEKTAVALIPFAMRRYLEPLF